MKETTEETNLAKKLKIESRASFLSNFEKNCKIDNMENLEHLYNHDPLENFIEINTLD
jgi:hypothetical protein